MIFNDYKNDSKMLHYDTGNKNQKEHMGNTQINPIYS